MKIGIDVDNTMTDINKEYIKAEIEYDKYLGNSGNPPFNWNEEDNRKFIGTFIREIINNAKLKNGLIEILNKLKEEGHEIIVITTRSNYYYGDSYKMTKEWLDKEKIPYDKLITGRENKKEVCFEEHIDIFLDDYQVNCQMVNELGIKVYIMDNINNYLDDPNIERVYDFYDFYNKIKIKKKVKR